jgi:glucose-1-phosphatase
VRELSQRIGAELTLDDCIAARAAAMSADEEVLALANRAAKSARLAILTNNGLLLRDYLPRICPPLFPLFAERVTCSAQFRLRKPDPEIYRRCLAHLGVRPEQALFIDDKPINAQGARAAGLMAHHFRSPALLRAELQSLNLIGAEP